MSNDNVAHALAGAGGGALSTIVTYPLITLSTRAQTESKRAKQEKAEALAAGNDIKRSASVLDAARQIIAREGISGLYSGLESALVGISATNFVYYYFYEGTKTFYELSKRKAGKSLNLTTGESMLAGLIAGSATAILTNPIWVVNTRMMVKDGVKDSGTGKPKSLGTLETVQKIIREDGFKPFFSGILPALVLVINPILHYTIFEQLKNAIEKRRKLRPLDFFLMGALGKIIATSITYPYITLKSRLQLRQKESAGKNDSSLIGGLLQIIKNEGIGGLYGGIVPKVTQSALSSAFLFLFKEQLFAVALALLTLLRKLKGN